MENTNFEQWKKQVRAELGTVLPRKVEVHFYNEETGEEYGTAEFSVEYFEDGFLDIDLYKSYLDESLSAEQLDYLMDKGADMTEYCARKMEENGEVEYEVYDYGHDYYDWDNGR